MIPIFFHFARDKCLVCSPFVVICNFTFVFLLSNPSSASLDHKWIMLSRKSYLLPMSTIEMDFEADFYFRAAEQDQRDNLQLQLQEAVQEANELRDCLNVAEDKARALQLELDDVTAKLLKTRQQLHDALDEGDNAEARAEELELQLKAFQPSPTHVAEEASSSSHSTTKPTLFHKEEAIAWWTSKRADYDFNSPHLYLRDEKGDHPSFAHYERVRAQLAIYLERKLKAISTTKSLSLLPFHDFQWYAEHCRDAIGPMVATIEDLVPLAKNCANNYKALLVLKDVLSIQNKDSASDLPHKKASVSGSPLRLSSNDKRPVRELPATRSAVRQEPRRVVSPNIHSNSDSDPGDMYVEDEPNADDGSASGDSESATSESDLEVVEAKSKQGTTSRPTVVAAPEAGNEGSPSAPVVAKASQPISAAQKSNTIASASAVQKLKMRPTPKPGSYSKEKLREKLPGELHADFDVYVEARISFQQYVG